MEWKPQVISVGDVLVELKRPALRSPLRKMTIKYPSRLDAACTDPGKLYSIKPKDNIYPTGQINFCANICKTITVKPRDDDIDFIFLSTARPGFCIVTRNIGKKGIQKLRYEDFSCKYL